MWRACKVAAGGFVGVLLLCAGITAVSDYVISSTEPPVGHFIETTAGRQHVLDVGPDFVNATTAPPIVLLHGATANLEDMRLALADRLRTRLRIIAVDRPGHGWSERADGEADASPRRQAEVLHEILQKTGAERPILVAHSWSGSVALAYAVAYPDQLSAVVLLAPVAYRWAGDITREAQAMTTPVLGTLFVHTLAVPMAWIALDWAVNLAFAPQPPPADYIDHASILLSLRPAEIMANAEDLAAMDKFPTPAAARYSQIKVPIVVIAGTDDHLVPPRDQAGAIARQLPQVRLIMLSGVGHMLHHVDPQRVIAAIDALISPPRTGVRQDAEGAGLAVTPQP
jgi:pimeloyl-ACP methyl ester carboxylesterase